MIKYIRVTLWGRLYVTLKEMHCLIGFASEAEGKSQFKKKSLFNTVVEGAHLLVHVLESPPPEV